jgi:hypothetical protein
MAAMHFDRTRLLLVSGSTRKGSTNEATLKTLRALAAARGVEATLFEEMTRLPHFNPDDDGDCLAPVVEELRWAIGDADAVVFSAPEYAGALPGSFKNLLDWTVGGAEMYRKPVAWINVAAEGRRGHGPGIAGNGSRLPRDRRGRAGVPAHTGRSRRRGRAWRHRRRRDSSAAERGARRPTRAPCRRLGPMQVGVAFVPPCEVRAARPGAPEPSGTTACPCLQCLR